MSLELSEADRGRVQDIVKRLLDQARMTPTEISEALQNRVSSRTIYRWAKGESFPGNSYDLTALEALCDERCK